MMDDRFDGFAVNLELDEDGDWLAHFAEMPQVSAFGATPEEALHELSEAWKGVKESYQAHGEDVPQAPARRKFSGQFNVRVGRKIHRELAIQAAREGISLNALVARLLAKDARELVSA